MTQRIFTSDDQLAFAKLSGDYNPLHMDPIYARRLLFGRQVVMACMPCFGVSIII